MTATAAESWVCLRCRGPIPMASDTCPACQWSLRAALSAADPAASPGASDAAPPPSAHRRLRALGLALRELVVLNLLFVAWRLVGAHASLHVAGADRRGLALWRWERALRLPSERSVQQLMLAHPALTRPADEFYAWAHAGAIVLLLAWLWTRHRDRYAHWRNVLVAFTGAALVVGLLPVAPPRLLSGLHLVDTAARDHTSVYSGIGRGVADQLSAMPSVHVGWALLVAVAVITASQSRWRWTVLAHPLVTVAVVVATANHYWLDGVAASLLLAAVLGAFRLAHRGSQLSPGEQRQDLVVQQRVGAHDAAAVGAGLAG